MQLRLSEMRVAVGAMVRGGSRQWEGFRPPGTQRKMSAGKGNEPRYKFEELYDKNHQNLPRLPIPNLDSTLDRYLRSLSGVVSAEEIKKHKAAVDDFREDDGPLLQQQLLEEDNHEGYPHSYVEKHWDDMYLELRSPISVHVNVGYSLRNDKDTNKPNAQSVRVSKFLISTFKWQRKLMLGLCEGEKGGPFCMSQLGRLLGTSRIPTYGRDRLRFTPDSRHIVVMRHNIFYRVDVMSEDGSSIISQDQLQKQLQHIIDTTKEGEVPGNDSATFLEGCGVGILTMEDRNLWAHHREALKANSVHNRFVLSTINSALLVVCFDKSSPNNMTERSQALLHGTQSSICNRWFDKFQVIADDDGNVGINFEHSHADGVSWNRWLTEVWNDMQGEEPPAGMSPLPDIPVVQAMPGVTGPRRLDFDVPYQLVAPIKATQQRAIALIASPETHMFIFEGFGKSQMKLWKSSPDGVVQMALQAAYFKLYGKLGPTYESCATRSFFHGRTEVIRSAHAEALSFSAGLFDDGLSKGDKEQLLRKALEWQGRLSKEASQAQGVDRHLLGLKKIAMGITSHSPPLASLVADSSKLPAMFHEAPFSYSQTWLLSTSNVTSDWNVIFNFGPVCDDGYGIGYLIHSNQIHFNITSFKASHHSDTMLFGKAVEDCLLKIREEMG